jgi:ubiquinone/menaquinone biosynthesis C-methylase UbiE
VLDIMTEYSRRLDLRKLRRELSYRIHLTRPREFGLFRRWLELGAGQRICDIGCGDGYWTSRLAGHGQHPVGVDVDTQALARARSFYGGQVRFVAASAERLPFGERVFDKVVSLSALQHFSDDYTALREIHRVLRRNGLLCMSMDSLSLESIPSHFKEIQARRYQVNRLHDHASIRFALGRTAFELITYAYVGRSRLFSWLMQFQVVRRWNVNYLAPLSLPLASLADTLSQTTNAGYALVVAARRA